MKWIDKELVVGTEPPIRIGRRVFKGTDGSQKATETFWATFSIGGKQRFVSLEVFRRADAIREAHRLAQRLESQTQPLAERTNIKLGEIVDAYLGLLRGRGRAFKTLEKYEYVLKTLQTWWEKRGNKAAINKWQNQGGTEWSGTIALVAGQKYDIKLRYVENGWGALATLSCASASTAKQIIPNSQLYTPAPL